MTNVLDLRLQPCAAPLLQRQYQIWSASLATWLDSLRIGHHHLHGFNLKICKAGGGDCGAHEVCTSVKDAINCNKE